MGCGKPRKASDKKIACPVPSGYVDPDNRRVTNIILTTRYIGQYIYGLSHNRTQSTASKPIPAA